MLPGSCLRIQHYKQHSRTLLLEVPWLTTNYESSCNLIQDVTWFLPAHSTLQATQSTLAARGSLVNYELQK